MKNMLTKFFKQAIDSMITQNTYNNNKMISSNRFISTKMFFLKSKTMDKPKSKINTKSRYLLISFIDA